MAVKFDPAKLAEPLQQVYQDVTDQVLENIARHFNTGKNLPTLDWQIKKLAELGQVRDETIRIIAKGTGQNEEMIRIALQGAIDAALKDVEPALREAARIGMLQDGGELTASESVQRIFDTYLAQAKDATNLVNTVMLESGMNAFRSVVSDTVQWEQQATTAAQTQAAQEILNSETGKVITGVSSRQEALRRAIKRMADNGLTGFVDRGGHNWTPEAYVNMDIRTTAGNVATQAVFARNEDYGNDLVWVLTKAEARPLCYPWQGKLISMNNRTGTVQDLDGDFVQITPVSATSYGKPAGLWGINCGHVPPNPFIPGLSKIRGTPLSEKVNEERYAESQRQRYLERKIRYAKREAATLDAAGLDADEAFAKVKRYQADLRAFNKETGRTARLDRTQVFGYNKSVSAKATAAVKRAESEKLLKDNMMATGALPKEAEIHLKPIKINIQSLDFDDKHINKERYHKVTEKEAKNWIENALFSTTVWKGQFERFYSKDGATYVNMDNHSIRTAFSSSDYDEKTKSLIEVFINANAR